MFRTVNRGHRLFLAGAAAAGLLLAAGGASARGFHVMYSFPDLNQDGASPHAGLIGDAAGNLYGTTWTGGGYQTGNGTVFKLAPDGTETVLHAFEGGAYGDGDWPDGTLVLDASGNLYGTTAAGGVDGGCGMNGCGTVFKIAPDGSETELYIFNGGSDGASPMGALLPDGTGGFYGTAESGGTGNLGAVFHISAKGKETVLYAFAGGNDGEGPISDLIADKKGNLYGTTEYGGGSGCMGVGCGTVFKVTPGGAETVLYAFSGASDGAGPIAGLLWGKAGALYGTAEFGGAEGGCGGSGCGTVFKVTRDGAFRVLYAFTGANDGGQPAASLIRDAKNNLYGTTLFGGAEGFGTVFRLAADGTESVLHTFANRRDGAMPWCRLFKDASGRLVGSTSGGGAYNNGTIFEVGK